MVNLLKNKQRKIILLFITLSIIVVEVGLSFFGPMATLDKTTLIVSPIYNSPKEDEAFIEELTDIIESHMVRTGSFTIVKQNRFEDYFNKHPDERKDYQPYKDYLKIAHEAGIQKIIVVSLYGSEKNGYTILTALRDCEKDVLMMRKSFDFSSF